MSVQCESEAMKAKYSSIFSNENMKNINMAANINGGVNKRRRNMKNLKE
jgi:hypothetical protein